MDAGTTNTRAWLLGGEEVLARREAAVGARDTARDRDNARLRQTLRSLISDLLDQLPRGLAGPERIAAAGMVTSRQGLVEVPHVVAPAGLAELAAAAQERTVAGVSELPFLLVPGVRTVDRPSAPEILAGDVMRGEETLCLGLVRQGRLAPGEALLNVGSHWKLIGVDDAGRVAWSITSLAGEMVQAVRTRTILASALPEGPLVAVDVPLLLEGMAEARRSGLSRALFCVRLLELAGRGAPEGRLSFFVGAFIGADLERLQTSGALPRGTAVAISGGERVGGAWAVALQEAGCPARSLSTREVEGGFLAGLRAVVEARDR